MKKLMTVCILSVIAFLNAIYLTNQYYRIVWSEWANVSSFCDINNTFSCSNVLASPYSQIFWLPFPAIAIAVYPLIFLVAFLWMNFVIKKPFHILAGLGLWWMMFNWFFIVREFLYIWSFCPFCLICSAIIVTIFIIWLVWIFNPIEEPKKPQTLIDKLCSIFKCKKSKK